MKVLKTKLQKLVVDFDYMLEITAIAGKIDLFQVQHHNYLLFSAHWHSL